MVWGYTKSNGTKKVIKLREHWTVAKKNLLKSALLPDVTEGGTLRHDVSLCPTSCITKNFLTGTNIAVLQGGLAQRHDHNIIKPMQRVENWCVTKLKNFGFTVKRNGKIVLIL